MECEKDRTARFSEQLLGLSDCGTIANIAIEGMRTLYERLDPAQFVQSEDASELPELAGLDGDEFVEPSDEEMAKWEAWAETAIGAKRTPSAAERFEHSLRTLDELWGQKKRKVKLCRELGQALGLLYELVRGQDKLTESFFELMESLESELECARAS